MGKFCVVNCLKDETIVVKEGSGSTYSKVTSIPPGKYCEVSVDSKATCREFCLVLQTSEKLQERITSDECLVYAEVRITGYDDFKLISEKIPKTSRDVSGMTTDANLSKAWQSVLRFFGIGGKRRAPVPQTGVAS